MSDSDSDPGSDSDEQRSGDEARFGNASKEMFARKKREGWVVWGNEI